MIDTKELRRLVQAATPGGWYVARSNYVYGCKEVTDGEEVWHPIIACTDDDEVSINFEGNAKFIAAANPAAISELLDRLEAAEKSDAESLAMYRKARDERDALRAALRHEADCVEAAKAEIEALRAKITEMEQQEPVSWADAFGEPFRQKSEIDGVASPLYALPGAKGE